MILLLALGGLHAHVEQAHSCLFHVGIEGFDAGEDVVVEHLEHEGNDDTEDGRDQSDLHTSGDDGRADITSALDIVEGLHHTDHCAEEAE